MRVFLSAGEPSGDHHAAVLARELRARRPDVECVGLGGPQMEAAGCQLVADLTRLAVMWFLRVILSIHRFFDLARRAERSFIDSRPDVCVLVDFPGFHWWLAWRAKRHGIPVVFYCPPQIWAWASWRKKKMRRLVDHVLSPLPFEHEWFMAQGLRSTLVGHPFFDDYDGQHRPGSLHEVGTGQDPSGPGQSGRHVILLPGSRGQEIGGNLGSILRAAALVRRRVPEARFTVAALHERHAARVREVIAASDGVRGLGIAVAAGRTRELIALVNLLASREPIGPVRPALWPPRGVPPADPEAVFPEYLAVGDPADRAAGHVIEWLEDPAALGRARSRVAAVAARVAHPGSAARAADAVLAIAAGEQPASMVGQTRQAA